MNHHLLVSPSPLYLIGLESVIGRLDTGSVIYSSKTLEDAKQIFLKRQVEFIWWAYEIPFQTLVSNVILPSISENAKVKIILLQHSHPSDRIKELFRLGLAGYLCDNCSIEYIVEAFQSCNNNFAYIDPRTTRELSTNYFHNKKEVLNEQLTEREKEVLQLIVKGHTTREIAADLFISKSTVETHRLHLIRKIGVKNTASLVREAMNLKLCPSYI